MCGATSCRLRWRQRFSGATSGGVLNHSAPCHLATLAPGILVLDTPHPIHACRKDLLDEALLRPGRLEVQVEIGLPDEAGRLQILSIHTSRMSQNSFLGRDVDLAELAERTKNFSGAEIEGLVKSATSFALNRQVGELGEGISDQGWAWVTRQKLGPYCCAAALAVSSASSLMGVPDGSAVC